MDEIAKTSEDLVAKKARDMNTSVASSKDSTVKEVPQTQDVVTKTVPTNVQPPSQSEQKETTESTPKKRIRRRQSVKIHNKKLSISVICANPYIKQFS